MQKRWNQKSYLAFVCLVLQMGSVLCVWWSCPCGGLLYRTLLFVGLSSLSASPICWPCPWAALRSQPANLAAKFFNSSQDINHNLFANVADIVITGVHSILLMMLGNSPNFAQHPLCPNSFLEARIHANVAEVHGEDGRGIRYGQCFNPRP